MKPTARLRFVERFVADSTTWAPRSIRILQQWWASDPDSLMDWQLKANGEWRDVPFESEE